MLALSFGTDAEREHALHGIRPIHTRVNGQLRGTVGSFPAGSAYSAEDPALVLWVHLTLLESIRWHTSCLSGPSAIRTGTATVPRAPGWPHPWARDPPTCPSPGRTRPISCLACTSGVLAVGSQAHELSVAVLAPAFRECFHRSRRGTG